MILEHNPIFFHASSSNLFGVSSLEDDTQRFSILQPCVTYSVYFCGTAFANCHSQLARFVVVSCIMRTLAVLVSFINKTQTLQ